MDSLEFREDVSPPTQEASSVPADCWGDVPDPALFPAPEEEKNLELPNSQLELMKPLG